MWDASGPYACSADDTCPAGYTCDDGLCCVPGGAARCPTLPAGSTCPDGSMAQPFYEDFDGDGYGNSRVSKLLCAAPQRSRWAQQAGDCDDTDPVVHPGAPEVCNGKDDNCNGDIDEGLTPRTQFFRDIDGDGFGQADLSVMACLAPQGFVPMSGDCDPLSASRHPGAVEVCNGLDDNCNGAVDEPPLADTWNLGQPADTFGCDTGLRGVCAKGNYRCTAAGRACVQRLASTDEVCDGVDNDCNGQVDEQPGCGGPPSLLDVPGATYGAQRLPQVGATIFSSRCPKDYPGWVATTWSSPTWSFTTPVATGGYHVFWVEAPPGKTWDLSAPGNALVLAFAATATQSWGVPTHFLNPVVYLCGEKDTELVRYVDIDGALQNATTSVSTRIPLNGGNRWVVGIGSGFDTTRVKRIEVMVWPDVPSTQSGDFTITFAPSTGFSKP